MRRSEKMIPKLRFKADDGSEFPNWEEKRLGDITQKVVRKADNKSMADVRMISQGNGFILQSQKYSRENAGKSLKKYTLLKKNEFAYNHGASKVKPYGVCYRLIESDEARVPYVYHTFRLKNGNEDYWNYALNTPEMDRQLKKMVSSGVRMDGLLNINYETYMSVKVLFPSLPEQKKIATFLSTIDDIITATQLELTAWKEYKKGVMQKIFNREVRFQADDGSEFPEWEERRIDSFANCYAGATPSTKVVEYWNNGSIPWMSSGEVNNREIYETEKKISELGYEKSSTKMIQSNTVVIALAGQGKTRGMVAITRIPLCTNQSLCAIETNDTVNDDYLYQYLLTQYEKLRRISSGDGTRGGLNLQLVGEYKVFLPVLPEQKKIADCLSSLDDVINQVQAELSAWKEFKKGLLQQMFAGNIDEGWSYIWQEE